MSSVASEYFPGFEPKPPYSLPRPSVSPANSSSDQDMDGPAAERREAPPAVGLPCLFKTTASKDEPPPLPGPRKKQAEALTQNIKWMAETFGAERIGFLTLTLGDLDTGGKYRNLRDRKEAQRCFHSLLTNEISKVYLCGVIVTERHKNGGIHFHLAVVCKEDIRGLIDFSACFPPKSRFGEPAQRPDYSTANAAIIRQWAYWRRKCKLFGFGRHQLQPMRSNGEALGRYLGKYLQKDWNHRLRADKGARCIRYFGHWSRDARTGKERRKTPPYNSRFGWMTPRSCAWREMIKQTVLVLNHNGAKITEQNTKDILGQKWAWSMGKLFEKVWFVEGDWQDPVTRGAIAEHNFKVEVRWLSEGGDPSRKFWLHVTEVRLDNLRPSPEWFKQAEDLRLAKGAEAAIRGRIRERKKRQWMEKEKRRMLRESLREHRAFFGQPF